MLIVHHVTFAVISLLCILCVAYEQIELTYSGIKTGFDYFFPDQHFDPLFPEYANTQCVPLAAFGLEPLSDYEEQQVGIYHIIERVVSY